jgi:hypothetical protein
MMSRLVVALAVLAALGVGCGGSSGPSKAQRGGCTVAVAEAAAGVATQAQAVCACPWVPRRAMRIVLHRERRRFLRNFEHARR